MFSSSILSLTPVTVTDCGVLQFVVEKTKLATLTVPSVRSLEETGIVTSAVGAESSDTLMVTVPPASVVAVPLGAATDTPAVPSRKSRVLLRNSFWLFGLTADVLIDSNGTAEKTIPNPPAE